MTAGGLKVLAGLTLIVILCVMVSFYQLRLSQLVCSPQSPPIHPSLLLSKCDCKQCMETTDREALREMIRGPLDQADDRLADIIAKYYLIPPIPETVPYKLARPSEDPSMGQSAIVKKIFEGERSGFFIECGALDGETRSNTLSLEKDFGWQGLLIEGDPSNVELVRAKNRKAWLADCCLAINPYPHVTNFLQDFNVGQIVDPHGLRSKFTDSHKVTERQCFPLYSILRAMNISKVDYFSLDVEGFELEVLRTIPFDKIQIKVLSVEFQHNIRGSEPLLTFMKRKGYRVLTQVTAALNRANDFIFVHKNLKNTVAFPPVNAT